MGSKPETHNVTENYNVEVEKENICPSGNQGCTNENHYKKHYKLNVRLYHDAKGDNGMNNGASAPMQRMMFNLNSVKGIEKGTSTQVVLRWQDTSGDIIVGPMTAVMP